MSTILQMTISNHFAPSIDAVNNRHKKRQIWCIQHSYNFALLMIYQYTHNFLIYIKWQELPHSCHTVITMARLAESDVGGNYVCSSKEGGCHSQGSGRQLIRCLMCFHKMIRNMTLSIFVSTHYSDAICIKTFKFRGQFAELLGTQHWHIQARK